MNTKYDYSKWSVEQINKQLTRNYFAHTQILMRYLEPWVLSFSMNSSQFSFLNRPHTRNRVYFYELTIHSKHLYVLFILLVDLTQSNLFNLFCKSICDVTRTKIISSEYLETTSNITNYNIFELRFDLSKKKQQCRQDKQNVRLLKNKNQNKKDYRSVNKLNTTQRRKEKWKTN